MPVISRLLFGLLLVLFFIFRSELTELILRFVYGKPKENAVVDRAQGFTVHVISYILVGVFMIALAFILFNFPSTIVGLIVLGAAILFVLAWKLLAKLTAPKSSASNEENNQASDANLKILSEKEREEFLKERNHLDENI